jgi:hypothetical protein
LSSGIALQSFLKHSLQPQKNGSRLRVQWLPPSLLMAKTMNLFAGNPIRDGRGDGHPEKLVLIGFDHQQNPKY